MPPATTIAILLVENEPLIAMDLEAMLRSAGFDRVDHVLTCREALDWLDRRPADVVILDLIVNDGSTAPVAERLRGERTPFLVCSGLTRSEVAPGSAFDDAVWLSKPCTQSELTSAIEQVLRLPPR